MVPLGSHSKFVEGNMDNLSWTIPINFSWTPRKIENFYIGEYCYPDEIEAYTKIFKEIRDVFAWLYDEIPRINPHIIEDDINTYLDARPIRQRLRAMNTRKAPVIKEEIEKLLKFDFIYPVPLRSGCQTPF